MAVGWQNSRLVLAVCVVDSSEKEKRREARERERKRKRDAMQRNAARVKFLGWSIGSPSQPK